MVFLILFFFFLEEEEEGRDIGHDLRFRDKVFASFV